MSLNVKGVKIRVADAAAQVGVGPKASSSAAAATAAGATVAGPSPQDNLRKTARTLFCLSYAALWCALTSHGWQRTEFQGERELDGKVYHQAYIGSYGLFDVQFEQTGATLSVPYRTWSLAQGDPWAYPLILAVSVCISLAAAAGAVVFLAHLRGRCARRPENQARFAKWSAYAAVLQCVFTAGGVVAWRCVRRGAFDVFCTRDGCVKEDPAGVRALSVYYAWVFALVSDVIALFLALTLWRLAHFDEQQQQQGGEEVEIPLAFSAGGPTGAGGIAAHNGVIHVPHPEIPHRTLHKTRSPAVMGAGPSPRLPAEAWNPQLAHHQYAPVGAAGQSPGKGGKDAAPSWLAGV